MLKPARLLAMDGNNSVKRLLSAAQADERVFESDYFLSRDEVEEYKDETQSRRTETNDAPWVPDSDHEPDDVFDANGQPATCADSWKASAAELDNRKSNVYNITGMFASVCRHGFVTKVCEMVQSGKQ